MRLNWFSPLPPERTDIAHYTARLAPALMERFDVSFWTDLKVDRHGLPSRADVRTFHSDHIEGHDFNAQFFGGLNVYNLGNDARFHAGIARVALKIPGVVILHDTRLHHFVLGLSSQEHPRFASYLKLARQFYGPGGEAKARDIIAADGRTVGEHVREMPFAEAFADRALGVICHSKGASLELRQRSDTPILVLPLPFSSLASPPSPRRDWRPPWRLVMFGYIHENRRLEGILRALGGWRDAPEFRFDIYGTLWDRPRIDALIARMGLKSRVNVHGFVSEQTLDEAIAAAHLAFNLRHPTMGEASGGILRSWAHATPTLVTNSGWYADLPDALTRKISAETEVRDIQLALSDLAHDPEAYVSMGLSARDWAMNVHAPSRYADNLGTAFGDLSGLMTRFASRQLLWDVAAHAHAGRERDALLGRSLELISSLFVPNG